MKQQTLKTLLCASVLMAGVCSSARATVDLQFTWSGSFYQTGFSAGGIAPINGNEAIGIYKFKRTDGNQTTDFYSVCLSPSGVLDANPHSYNTMSFAAANPGQYPAKWASGIVDNKAQYWGINNAAFLWNEFGMDIVNNTDGIGYQNQRAAALEFAIWTSLYNSTGYGMLGANKWAAPTGMMGDASNPNSTLYYYYQYLNAVTSANIPGALYNGDILEGTKPPGADYGEQQMLFMLGNPIPRNLDHQTVAVPEPGTIIAGVLLLLPFGVITLRGMRRNSKA